MSPMLVSVTAGAAVGLAVFVLALMARVDEGMSLPAAWIKKVGTALSLALGAGLLAGNTVYRLIGPPV